METEWKSPYGKFLPLFSVGILTFGGRHLKPFVTFSDRQLTLNSRGIGEYRLDIGLGGDRRPMACNRNGITGS
jgi:hypothetical protein